MTTTFTGIQNENEFYSHHYLAELFANDIQATTARWREAVRRRGEERGDGRPIRPCVRWRILTCVFRQQFGHERRDQGARQVCNATGSATC